MSKHPIACVLEHVHTQIAWVAAARAGSSPLVALGEIQFCAPRSHSECYLLIAITIQNITEDSLTNIPLLCLAVFSPIYSSAIPLTNKTTSDAWTPTEMFQFFLLLRYSYYFPPV